MGPRKVLCFDIDDLAFLLVAFDKVKSTTPEPIQKLQIHQISGRVVGF